MANPSDEVSPAQLAQIEYDQMVGLLRGGACQGSCRLIHAANC